MPRMTKAQMLMNGVAGPEPRPMGRGMMGYGMCGEGLLSKIGSTVESSTPNYPTVVKGESIYCPSCETHMIGGKVKIGKAFNRVGDYVTSKKGGLASDLIQYGIPAASSALLGGLATAATGGNPAAGIAASAVGSKLGAMGAAELQKKTGTGMVRKGRFEKGSQAAKDYMKSLRDRKSK